MSILTRIVVILILAIVAAGLIVVAVWDIPPPADPIEKVLPDERFPR